MRARRVLFAPLALIAVAFAGTAVSPASLAPAATIVQRALALIQRPTIGTAFAIRSQTGKTLYLTAAHVIGCDAGGGHCLTAVDLYLAGDLQTPHHATVIAHGDVDHEDLALLALDEGPLITISGPVTLPLVGRGLASLGFPADRVDEANNAASEDSEIDASLSIGAVASPETDGVFEFSGATYKGDSGGPIFDPKSGAFFGVVHAQAHDTFRYQGVGEKAIAAFLEANDYQIEASLKQTPVTNPEIDVAAATTAACRAQTEKSAEIRCYETLADRGDHHAEYLAAVALFGLSVKLVEPTPEPEAFPSPPASARLANMIEPRVVPGTTLEVVGSGATEGVHYLRLAAAAHDIDAEWLLGRSLEYGLSPFTEDPLESGKWRRRAYDDALAANQADDLHGQYLLGRMMTDSSMFGMAQIEAFMQPAERILANCSKRGGGECSYQLGQMYLNQPDSGPETANHWFLISAGQQFKPAMVELGWSYARGRGAPVDRAQSAEWYRKAFPFTSILDMQTDPP